MVHKILGARSQEPRYTSDLSLPARRSAPWRAAACLLLFALAAPAPVQAQTELPAGWSLIPSGARAGDDFRLLIVTSTRQTAANTDIADYNAVVQNDVSNTGHADIQGYAANFRMLGCTETVSAITNANTGSTDPAASIYWLNGAKVADDYAGLYDGSWDSNAPKFPDGENAPTSGLISQTLVGCTPAGMIDGTNHLAAALVTQGYPGFSGSEFGVFPVLVKESRRFYGLSEIFRVPANTPATGAPAITGTARVGQTLTASTSGITDADGLTNVSYVYRWIRLDSDGMMNPTDIGTDASTYTLVAADVGKKIQVGVSFQDDSGNDEALTSTAYPSGIATVPAVAAPATGAPAITGTARVGQTLTASTGGIMDADGLSRVSYGYRWIRVDSDGMMNPTDIGTDASTYTLVAADEGKKIQVEVSFQDDRGNDEELTSEAYPSGTETIAAADTTNNAPTFTDGPSTSRSIAENTASGQNIGAPITATDADTGDTLTYDLGGTDAAAFGIVSASGQIQTRAALDYETKSSYTVTVTVSDGNGGSDSIDVTINVTPDDGGGDDGGGDGGDGEPTTSVPGSPRNLTAVVGDGQVVLSWDTPESDGGAEITDYEYRINGRNPWISIGSTLTTYTVTGLVNGTAYTFQVRAVNRIGTGRVPNQAEATPEEPRTVLLAHFANGNNTVFNSRVYLFNPSVKTGRVTVRVFTLPLRGGLAQELTTTPLELGSLGPKSGLNIKLVEDILTPLGITTPYTIDGGNLTLELTILAADVRGTAQVFTSGFAFGTYPLQEIPSTSAESPTVLVANFTNGNNGALNSRVYLWNPSATDGRVTVRVFTLPNTGDSMRLQTVPLGILKAFSARNIRIAEDILAFSGIALPYTDDGGNLMLEFTIEAPDVRGVAQVFSSNMAFGTYVLQEVPSTPNVEPTVLVAHSMNGNSAIFNSRVYLWNPSTSAGEVTVRVFTLPLADGTVQELTAEPLALDTLGSRSALNIKLAEDILTPLGIATPYTTDDGNLTLEFTIQAADVKGTAQVFSSTFASGTYTLQTVPSVPIPGPTRLVASFTNGNDTVFNSRISLFNPSPSAGGITVRVFTLPLGRGAAQELTTTPLELGTLEARSARDFRLAEDILVPLGVSLPYTTDGGNLVLELTIQATDVRGTAQVFSSRLSLGTYPLQ